jgi:hypothetical protein
VKIGKESEAIYAEPLEQPTIVPSETEKVEAAVERIRAGESTATEEIERLLVS